MAHFAKLDENNVVLEVNSVNNAELIISKIAEIANGYMQVTTVESEEKGIAFLTEWSGGHTNWIQTSYNGNFRGKYAGIGDTYDAEANEFRSPVVAPSVDASIVEPVVEVEPQVVVEAQEPIIVETQEPVVLETQATVMLESADIPALTSADIQALTSEQISGLE
jgi:hypothetical protein